MKGLTEKSITITKAVRTDRDAVEQKMKMLQPKLFGLYCPVKYSLLDRRKIYIPYELFIFNYELRRDSAGDPNKKGLFDRDGRIGIVFDLNEVYPFHFDLIENLKLETANATELDGEILQNHCTEKEAIQKSIETIKWQILRRVFHSLPRVELVSQKKFYRPAWGLMVEACGKRFERYAYLDGYMSENEHISGLKARLDV